MTDRMRVSTWSDFVGQTKTKDHLRVRIDAAKAQNRPLQHVFLYGSPGFGKTALAGIIANELGAHFESVNMPVTQHKLFELIEDADSYDETLVILLDEIHRASKKEQEFLLPLLEFNYLQGRSGERYMAGNITVIGATTERDRMEPALLQRFQIKPTFDVYSEDEMARIVLGMALRMKPPLEIDVATARVLGKATAGIPRNGLGLVEAARDLELDAGKLPTAAEILEFCRVDEDGLTADHFAYLRALKTLGGKSGLTNIKNLMQMPEAMIRELERHLLQLELIDYTDRGREMRPAGSRRINARRPKEDRAEATE